MAAATAPPPAGFTYDAYGGYSSFEALHVFDARIA
jgi:hypothetical protein